MASRRRLDELPPPSEGYDPYQDTNFDEFQDTTEGGWYSPGDPIGPPQESTQVDTSQNEVIERPNAPHAPQAVQVGRWSPDQQNQFMEDAKGVGADDAWIQDFLNRNPDDYNRLEEAFLPTSHRPYDSQTTDPYQLQANKDADIASGSPLANWWGGQGDPLMAFNLGGGGNGNGGNGNGGNGSGSSSGGPTGSSSSSGSPFTTESLKTAIAGLFPGGAFNTGIVDQRVDLARDAMNRQRSSSTKTNRAALANRGLLGDGPEITAANSLEERLYDQFTNATGEIYADESENADARMIEALALATGMTDDEAKNAIAQGHLDLGWKTLDVNKLLGQGNLALQNWIAVNGHNLDLAKFGLDQDELEWMMESGNTDQLIELIQAWLEANGQSNDGYEGEE